METAAPPVTASEMAEAPPGSLRELTRHVAIAGMAGVVAGVLVGGLGGRLFMRIAGAMASESAQGATTEAGFQVLAMDGIDSPFADVPKVPPKKILEFMKHIAARHKDAEGIYMLGSAWKTLDIIDDLEQSTGLTVVHASPARCCETQLRLGLRHPMAGYGKLLVEMPG